MPKLTKESTPAQLLAAYKGGMSLPEIAKELKRQPASVRGTLIRAAGGDKEWKGLVKEQAKRRETERDKAAAKEEKAEAREKAKNSGSAAKAGATA